MAHDKEIFISLKANTKSVFILSARGTGMTRKYVGLAAVTEEIERLQGLGYSLRDDSRAVLAAAAPLSEAQAERQRRRGRDGRYEDTNPCEICERKIIDYVSDRRVDMTDSAGNHWGGTGLCLCERCGIQLAKLPDQEAYEIVTGQRPADWIRRKATS